jgi:hypothetical protein
MRHAYGNTNDEPDWNTYGDINANSDANGSGLGYTNSDDYSHRHTVTHADVRTWWHTRAMGYCSARATCSLSCWWMH